VRKKKEVKEMSKVVQISILAKVSGNVNADEVIGQRVTIKKMYSSSGEVLPFVSARSIKFAIRQAFKEMGFYVDPFYANPNAEEALRLTDSGRPDIYIDNDLFGYMKTLGKGEVSLKRQAPIGISYLKAIRDTPVRAEFAARFPRQWGSEENPVPFEVEVAEFIGKVNCIMYDYIGKFDQDRKIAEGIKKKSREVENFLKEVPNELNDQERKKRIKAFVDIFLSPKYVLSRRTNSLNIPEYISALIVMSEKGPLPIYQYLNYDFNVAATDVNSLKLLVDRKEVKDNAYELMFIDYNNKIKDQDLPKEIKKVSVHEAIEKITAFL
jgi:CRISPR-associated protein Cst2